MEEVWKYFKSFVKVVYDIPEEELEELRMTSALEPDEICRLKRSFFEYTSGQELMTRDMFMDIYCIRVNPLKERISICFGFENGVSSLDFPKFLNGVALFNSHGKKEEKLKLAFRLQDFNDDGVLTREDMVRYLETITGQPGTKVAGWEGTKIADVVDRVFSETASDDKKQEINIQDFTRCLTSTDFHTKLQLSM